ncbi:MAG TPA: hypothetical protein VFO16_06405, partial [Pseudonocardiaceae bacterium]|nr:hypothetical protein [Pseudonocardiaceae bacterium]
MSTEVIIGIVIGIAVLVGIALAAAWSLRRRRRESLRERFGPEYDRMVRARGEREAEHHLSGIATRRDRLEIRRLEPEARS